ncbi:hypothetical protein BC835DRAFT_949640 [Cytidiella melzeri]|nr:hypothetical protein BC835DRAFT_949640 [Cytidiella melzeri]
MQFLTSLLLLTSIVTGMVTVSATPYGSREYSLEGRSTADLPDLHVLNFDPVLTKRMGAKTSESSAHGQVPAGSGSAQQTGSGSAQQTGSGSAKTGSESAASTKTKEEKWDEAIKKQLLHLSTSHY